MNKLFLSIISILGLLSCETAAEKESETIKKEDLLGGWRVVEKGWRFPNGEISSRHRIEIGSGGNHYYFTEDSMYHMEYPIEFIWGEKFSLFGEYILGENTSEEWVTKSYYRIKFKHDTLVLIEFFNNPVSAYYDCHLVRTELKKESVKSLCYNKVKWELFKENWVLSDWKSGARPDSFSCGFIEPEYLNLYHSSNATFKRDTLIYIEKNDTLCFKFFSYTGDHLNDRWTIRRIKLEHVCDFDCNGQGAPIIYDSTYE